MLLSFFHLLCIVKLDRDYLIEIRGIFHFSVFDPVDLPISALRPRHGK